MKLIAEGDCSHSHCKTQTWSRQRHTLSLTQTARRLGSSPCHGPSSAHQGLAFTLLLLNLPDIASTVLLCAQLTHRAPQPLLEFCLVRPSGHTTNRDELIAVHRLSLGAPPPRPRPPRLRFAHVNTSGWKRVQLYCHISYNQPSTLHVTESRAPHMGASIMLFIDGRQKSQAMPSPCMHLKPIPCGTQCI